MAVTVDHGYGASEYQALAELSRDGFEAKVADYLPGRTEAHEHDYDICLHVLGGEFRVIEAESGAVHACGPGAKLQVPAGTRHFEDHGAVRLVVGRRH